MNLGFEVVVPMRKTATADTELASDMLDEDGDEHSADHTARHRTAGPEDYQNGGYHGYDPDGDDRPPGQRGSIPKFDDSPTTCAGCGATGIIPTVFQDDKPLCNDCDIEQTGGVWGMQHSNPNYKSSSSDSAKCAVCGKHIWKSNLQDDHGDVWQDEDRYTYGPNGHLHMPQYKTSSLHTPKTSAVRPLTAVCPSCGDEDINLKQTGICSECGYVDKDWSEHATPKTSAVRPLTAVCPSCGDEDINLKQTGICSECGYVDKDWSEHATPKTSAQEEKCAVCGERIWKSYLPDDHGDVWQDEDLYTYGPNGHLHMPQYKPGGGYYSSRKTAGNDDWDAIMQSPEMKAAYPQMRQVASDLLSVRYPGEPHGSSDINHTIFDYAKYHWDGSHLDLPGLFNEMAADADDARPGNEEKRYNHASKTASLCSGTGLRPNTSGAMSPAGGCPQCYMANPPLSDDGFIKQHESQNHPDLQTSARRIVAKETGYFVVSRNGSPLSGPYATMSEAAPFMIEQRGATVQFQGPGDSEIWSLTKAKTFPVGMNTVNGSKKTAAASKESSMSYSWDTEEDPWAGSFHTASEKPITTADGKQVGEGDRVFNYYDGAWGTITNIDAPNPYDKSGPWFTHLEEDGSRTTLNGERVCVNIPRGNPFYEQFHEGRRKTAERRTLTLPYSEVNMSMGIAGQTLEGELTPSGNGVQLFKDGKPFSFPITTGEAGWGMTGSDHTLTDFDADGQWYPKTGSIHTKTAGFDPRTHDDLDAAIQTALQNLDIQKDVSTSPQGLKIVQVQNVPGGGHWDEGYRVFKDDYYGSDLPPGDVVATVSVDGHVTRLATRGSMQERYATGRRLASLRHFADDDDSGNDLGPFGTVENVDSEEGLEQVDNGTPPPSEVQVPNPLAGQDLTRAPANLLEAALWAQAEHGEDPYDWVDDERDHDEEAYNAGTPERDWQNYGPGDPNAYIPEFGAQSARTAAAWCQDCTGRGCPECNYTGERDVDAGEPDADWWYRHGDDDHHDQLDDPWNTLPSAGDY